MVEIEYIRHEDPDSEPYYIHSFVSATMYVDTKMNSPCEFLRKYRGGLT